jgi:hypothetical protein
MVDGSHGGNEDYRIFEWFLAYDAQTVRHLRNPFFTTLQNAPDGVNLMANTGLVGLGVPLAPVTWLAGPTVTGNLVICLALFCTAASWYHVLSRYVVTSRLAAAVGGALCGFGPGMLAHSRGHLNLIAQFLLPLIILLALRLAEPGRLVRRGVLVGVLVAWQVLISEETLLLAAVGTGVFTVAYALQRPAQARRLAPRLAGGLAVAMGTALVLVAYPLWMQFFGPQSYRTVPYVSGHGADLASYLAIPQLTIFGSQATNAGLALNPAEENTFFTVPYLAVVVAMTMWLWRRTEIRALVLTAGVLAVLSLGPALKIHGDTIGIPLPWRLLRKLPLLDSVLPARFGLAVGAVLAVVTAIGLDAAIRARALRADAGAARAAPRAAQVVLATLLAAALLPLVPRPLPAIPVGYPVPAFITTGQWRGYVRDHHTLVPVPIPDVHDASGLRWAAMTGVPFAVPGGYFLGPDAHGRGQYGPPPRPTFRLLSQVASTGTVPAITAADRANARADLAYWRADLVVLGQHRHANALRATLNALLGTGRPDSDVWTWNVQDVSNGAP